MEINRVIRGDCVEVMAGLPEGAADMIFADPPYNLQLNGELWRPNNTRVDGVEEDWDRFASLREYDAFTRGWLAAARRALKPDGTLWVIGSYHNIFRVGAILQDLDFWILNDIIWRKTNPMPNFRGRRFTNAHETMIWCARSQNGGYNFNYDAMKALNEDLQMRSDWLLPLCTGRERLKDGTGAKAHPTQKPEALLHRVILAATKPGDLVLDPFFGTGTTGAVAKKLGRNWLGVERDANYIRLAEARIAAVPEPVETELLETPAKRAEPRIPFGWLVERGIIQPGGVLFDQRRRFTARVKADGSIIGVDQTGAGAKGSIHQVGAQLQGAPSCNGWTFWYTEIEGKPVLLDALRQKLRAELH